jgi:pentose-5-phosphate-3-epimerase
MNLSHRVRVDGGINDETGVAGTRDRADIFIAGTSASGVRDLLKFA